MFEKFFEKKPEEQKEPVQPSNGEKMLAKEKKRFSVTERGEVETEEMHKAELKRRHQDPNWFREQK